MSARAGRMRRRLDENIGFDRPLDGNRDFSRTVSRTGRRARRIRACAVGGAVICGLAAPATARAADPFGTAQLTQEVNAAVAEATTALAPQPSAAAAPVPQAPASTLSAQTLEAATKTVEAVTTQAAGAASSAASEAQREAQGATTVPSVPAAFQTAAPRVRAHRRATAHHVPTAAPSSASQSSLRPRSVPLAGAESTTVARLLTASPAGRAQGSGARAAGAASKPTRASLPQRSPPLPLPPQPGAALSGQAGGHGPPTPPVLATLAAILLLMAFEFLPRTLPLRAFRKPRQIALRPEHPG